MPDDPVLRDNLLELPDPLPEFEAPELRGQQPRPKAYFDPERWDAELSQKLRGDERDPVKYDLGHMQGTGAAALFLSDFHMADGSAGGDDFLDSHLALDKDLGIHTGFTPAGPSRAGLFASVVTFALRRIERTLGADVSLDVVLNGDVINFLELKGRGGMLVSDTHEPFFRTLDVLGKRATVYWLRGNHDYVVPAGPWQGGEFYMNQNLETLAEHGDVWDSQNWPPGPGNKGSRLVIEAGSAFEVHAAVMKDGAVKYLMSGVDNVRPWNNDAVKAFLDRRSKYSDVAWLGAALARLKYVGAADDSAAYEGALARRKKDYANWLMVQGHTHVPAFVPGVYANTGSWIATLVELAGKEMHIEKFPFLLVYRGPHGHRLEEFYTASYPAQGARAQLVLHTPDSVNELRKSYGYAAIK